MNPALWTFWAGTLWAVGGLVWVLLSNAQALARHRVSLYPGRATRWSTSAWLLSVLALWMGPLLPVASGIALAIGLWERRRVLRGEISARSELPAQMAIRNAGMVGVVFLGVVLCLWYGWQSAAQSAVQ